MDMQYEMTIRMDRHNSKQLNSRHLSNKIPKNKLDITLAGTRHFANLYSTGGGGGGTTSPRVWLLSELELRFKNQRVACHETKPLTSEFKVLGQPVTSEVRSMSQKWPKCDFADNFVAEQARAAI